jgi:hypothetical protein
LALDKGIRSLENAPLSCEAALFAKEEGVKKKVEQGVDKRRRGD